MSALLRSPKGRVGVTVAVGLLLLAAMWFLLVAPQQSKAAELDKEIGVAQADLSQRRIALARPSAAVKVTASDLFRLTKALPNEAGMSEILLDVNRLAGKNALDFRSIAPAGAVLGTGYLEQPSVVIVQGRFADISRFLGDLRTLVTVRKGRLDTRGRLYSVSQVEMGAPDNAKEFPTVKATVALNAYTFSAPVPAPVPDPSTTNTDSSSGGTVAAGETP
jgi:Tfp pilus assembly protein PilO